MKYDVKVSFRTTSEKKKALEDRAQILGVTLSQFINLMIDNDSAEWEAGYHGRN